MSENEDKLKDYSKKRDFDLSPEPKGDLSESKDKNIFVIQKHNASNLHYDFRLEVNGVLKSWVLPKGPSTDPDEKRLAIPTEDHPLEYASFEGIIPKDAYGAGEVIVWDKGDYENTSEKDDSKVSMKTAINNGHVTINLSGEKLQGGYALIRTENGQDARWLFIKMKDNQADARRNPVSTEPESVISDHTIEELKENNDDRK